MKPSEFIHPEDAAAGAGYTVPTSDESGTPKFCSNCGTQMPASARFCPNCGSPLK